MTSTAAGGPLHLAQPADLLGDVIGTLRRGATKFRDSRRTGPWGASFGPYPGAGFHLVLDGSCWLTPPAGEPVPLAAGDVVLLPHGARHGMSDRPQRRLDDLPPDVPGAAHGGERAALQDTAAPGVHLLCGAYRLERGLAHPLLRSLPEVVHLPARPGRPGALQSAVDLLRTDLDDPRPGASAALPALMDLLLVYLLRSWLEEQADGGAGVGWGAALGEPALAAALHQVHRRPEHPWTVASLARAANLSRTTFARRFTAAVGRPPLAYLTWWRLDRGAQLLRTTDAPLSAIARQVGYGSEFAFAHAFRREFGTPPGRFRRERPPASPPGRVEGPDETGALPIAYRT